MMFRLLGPIELDRPDGPVDLGPAKQRCLLACLLLTPGRPVPVETLIDRVWGDRPPRQARNVLATYITRLRQALHGAGCGPEVFRLRHAFGGYLAECEPDLIDVHVSRGLIAAARSGDDPEAGVGLLDRALAGWQPVALAGVPGQWAERVRDGLRRERTDALAAWAELSLSTGAASAVVERLRPEFAQRPAAEELAGPLMTALHRAGLGAQALECYVQLCQALREELGVRPSPRLQVLHVQILQERPVPEDGPQPQERPDADGSSRPEPGGAAPAGTAEGGPPPGAHPPVPAQLPAAVPDFTGRADQMQHLDALLADAVAEQRSSLVISAIGGTGGVGKTALAVRWAHRVAERFPDGQLFVDLHGFGAGPPVRPVDALAGFLRALGVPGERIPIDVDECAALYRSRLAGRRTLIVLDNAASAEQVRPLLPGTPGCLVVITSRDRLGSLVATHGARYLPLDVLTEDEALDLLRRTLGTSRVGPGSGATELARVCGYLPLALRIAAAHLAGIPTQSIRAYLTQLAASGPVDSLSIAGDPDTAVRATFDTSYTRLHPEQQRVFRLLSLAPGPDIGVPAAAVLTGIGVAAAQLLLDQLAAAHLITQPTAGRYAMHDLLRGYAAQRARDADEPADRREAVERLLNWYLYSTDAATRLLHGYVRLDLPPMPADLPVSTFTGPDAAQAWCEAERVNLLSVIQHAAQHGPDLIACLLIDALRGYFWHSRHLIDWWEAAQAGLAVAQRYGDPRTLAAMLLGVGTVHYCLGDHDRAMQTCDQAREVAAQAGWHEGGAACNNNMAAIYTERGQITHAITHLTEALRLYQQTDNRESEYRSLANLGFVQALSGDLRTARANLAEALTLCRHVGSRSVEGHALQNLGVVTGELGDLDQARMYLRRALAAYRQISRVSEAQTRRDLVSVEVEAGRLVEARAMAESTLRLARDVRDRRVECAVHNLLGTIERMQGRPEQAITHHEEALRLARLSPPWPNHAMALIGIALARSDLGQHEVAVATASEAEQVVRDRGLRVVHGQALTALATIRAAQGRYDLASRHAEHALALHRATGHRLGEARTLAAMAEISELTGDWVGAARNLAQATEIIDVCGADPAVLHRIRRLPRQDAEAARPAAGV